MNLGDVNALREMLCGSDEEDEQQQVNNMNPGSMLNPGNFGDKKKSELAKPHAKMNILQGEKFDPTKLQQEQQQEEEPQKPIKQTIAKEKQIWTDDEIKELPILLNDQRQRPDVEELFKQQVGATDVFLGMSNMDPSTTKCQFMLLKIALPNTKHKEIQLDINQNGMVIQTPRYYLYHQFSSQVNEKAGNCKWVADKYVLELTLPMVKDNLMDF